MNSLLTDQHAVIYGGGGAIGAGVAATFAREGAHVHLAGRTLPALERVAAATEVASFKVLDALDESAVEQHLATLPRVDVSFNLIARGDVHGEMLLETTVEHAVGCVTTGATSNFITARAAARRMVEQRSGVILWISSGSARGAIAGMGGTGAADAATESLMLQFAKELGPHGVRVCGIYTAGVADTFGREHDTNAARRATGFGPEEIDKLIGGMAPLRRAPRLQEVADTAAFLASDRASGITGTVASVTAGLVS
jgi:NAD(P)-dependent dehydrogenase (short-subunit alcohol dehydrogenase family)